MIAREQMPEDNADLAQVEVSFPRLRRDTAESCPVPPKDVLEYLHLESADFDKIKWSDLRFLRTAKVAKRRYWIWEFYESDGDHCYVTVWTTLWSGLLGGGCIGYDANWHTLTPEQFILGDYHDVF